MTMVSLKKGTYVTDDNIIISKCSKGSDKFGNTITNVSGKVEFWNIRYC